MLEAHPSGTQYCERPATAVINGKERLVDFWLRMNAQLYPEPPPRHVDSMSAGPSKPEHRLVPKTECWPLRPTRYWPHFNKRFAVMERILNGAKHHRLRGTAFPCGTGDFGFDAQCIATQNTLYPADVATLGWCMSWYSFFHPRSVSQTPQHPAFGLAAWLAGTPVCPRKTLDGMWFPHIQDLLHIDLTALWNAWLLIAQFMCDREVYFLHPALSRADDFASKHHQCKEISSNL